MNRIWYRAKLRDKKDNPYEIARFIDKVNSFGLLAFTKNAHAQMIKGEMYTCCDVRLSKEEATILNLSFAGDLILIDSMAFVEHDEE